jgi:transcriptional regulator with XRE-family HTH domain
MTVPGSPTVRRRRLAAELREIRESKGKSGDAAAAALRWSPSKISRYEQASARGREVLDYDQITGFRHALLLELAQDASHKGWWEEYADGLPPTINSSSPLSTRQVRSRSGTLTW